MFDEQTERSSLSNAEKEKRLRATDHLPGPAGGVGSGPGREF